MTSLPENNDFDKHEKLSPKRAIKTFFTAIIKKALAIYSIYRAKPLREEDFYRFQNLNNLLFGSS